MNDKLNVIIDVRIINKKIHGIGRYAYEIVKYMSYADNIHMILLVNDLKLANDIFGEFNNIEFIKVKSKFLSILEQFELPKIVNKYKDKAIFHSPSFVSSPFIKCKMIMTIHDLNHLKFPQYYSPFHKYYYKYIVKPSALKCKKIVTVSKFSKSELVEWLKCDEDKIDVTYNGIDKKFEVINDKVKLDRVKVKYNLPDKFVLYIGNLKPHKNVESLIKAMALIEDGVKLIINGKANESINKIIHTLNIHHKVKFIGYVEDSDLPAVYNLAQVFVFPSLYEGFGLPALEAMACGCKVITSNTTSLKEVVNNHGICINPKDYNKLAFEIKRILNEQIMANVDSIKYAQAFTWEDTYKKTLKIYKEIFDMED